MNLYTLPKRITVGEGQVLVTIGLILGLSLGLFIGLHL